MNATAFVGISSLLLVAWLALAFLREVPSQRYQPVTGAGNPSTAEQTMQQGLAGREGAEE